MNGKHKIEEVLANQRRLRRLSNTDFVLVISVFGKSRKSCKIPILQGRKFVGILASPARLA